MEWTSARAGEEEEEEEEEVDDKALDDMGADKVPAVVDHARRAGRIRSIWIFL